MRWVVPTLAVLSVAGYLLMLTRFDEMTFAQAIWVTYFAGMLSGALLWSFFHQIRALRARREGS